MRSFDPLEVSLQGKNLIEASAGTGKTFSIAVLVLRLVLQKRMSLEKILMVTFTNAAVAELSSRIRTFINEALRYAKNRGMDEETDEIIKKIVEEAIQKSVDKNDCINLLEQAASFLDETAIYTINGFCQRTLTEFAFETGELFDSEIITDESDFIELVVNKFWRQHILVKSVDELRLISQTSISRQSIGAVIREVLKGNEYYVEEKMSFKECWPVFKEYDAHKNGEATILNNHARELSETIFTGTQNYEKEFCQFLSAGDYTANNPLYTKQRELRVNAKKKLSGHPVGDYYEHLFTVTSEYNKAREKYENGIYLEAIAVCVKDIETYKKRHALITQNDLIEDLYKTTQDAHVAQRIARGVTQKYEALFIDEFQDTDVRQYTIFTTLFPRTLTFFIGDPKQAIYGFRGADLDTYLEAVNDMDEEHTFTMANNYRSSDSLISAMNRFFAIENPFLREAIQYHRVGAGTQKNIRLVHPENLVPPFTIINPDTEKPHIIAARIVSDLLHGGYTVGKEQLNLQSHSIGILVRSKNQGKKVKAALAQHSIPAVLKQEDKVLESGAVEEFLFFLDAIISPSEKTIKKVFLSSLLPYTVEDIARMNSEYITEELQFFKELQVAIPKEGIFRVGRKMVTHFQLKQRLLKENRLRDLSNVLQCLELLHKRESEHASDIEELVSWVKRVREGKTVFGDEYEERIETDAASVEIATIHKCKGLDYDIVIAPWLNFDESNRFNYTIRNFKKDGHAFFTPHINNEFAKEVYQANQREENRRLLYVAITRAKYKVYAVNNKNGNSKKGTLQPFLEGLGVGEGKEQQDGLAHLCPHFEYLSADDLPTPVRPPEQPRPQKSISAKAKVLKRSLKGCSFTESFTSLDAKSHEPRSIERIENADEYDTFIFDALKKGAAVGTFLHEIFETLDFGDNTRWSSQIKRIGNANISAYDETLHEQYINLVTETVSASLPCGFTLCEIPMEKRLAEMEFYFKLSGNTGDFENVFMRQGYPTVKVKNVEIDGALKGFIDLLFQHQDKYYILDWKSNHIGYSLEHYTTAAVTKAMEDNNYILQYLLYSVAVKRFLEQRGLVFEKSFGGVLYLFLRGLRKNKQTGIYYKPASELFEVVHGLDCILS